MKNTEVVEKGYEILEDFPLWQECRKLVKLLANTRIKWEGENEKFFRNSATSMAETIFITSAELFEKMKSSMPSFELQNGMEELAKLRTTVYILFDKGKISRDDFTAVIVQLSRIRKEFDRLIKQERPIMPGKCIRDADCPDGLPTCNTLPDKKNKEDKK